MDKAYSTAKRGEGGGEFPGGQLRDILGWQPCLPMKDNPPALSRGRPSEVFLAHLRTGHPRESGLDSELHLACLDHRLRRLLLSAPGPALGLAEDRHFSHRNVLL